MEPRPATRGDVGTLGGRMTLSHGFVLAAHAAVSYSRSCPASLPSTVQLPKHLTSAIALVLGTSLSDATSSKLERRASDATVYRLSLYHCYLEDLIQRDASATKITSRQLARALDLNEETVRRDLSVLKSGGRPGSGYETFRLLLSLSEFLGVADQCAIVKVGSAEMLAAVGVIFPAERYGVRPVACFTEEPADVGKVVDGLEIRHLADIASHVPMSGAKVALIATEPQWAQVSVDLLQQAGVTGFMLLTPVAAINHAEGTSVYQLRMPCVVKSLSRSRGVTVAEEFADA